MALAKGRISGTSAPLILTVGQIGTQSPVGIHAPGGGIIPVVDIKAVILGTADPEDGHFHLAQGVDGIPGGGKLFEFCTGGIPGNKFEIVEEVSASVNRNGKFETGVIGNSKTCGVTTPGDPGDPGLVRIHFLHGT